MRKILSALFVTVLMVGMLCVTASATDYTGWSTDTAYENGIDGSVTISGTVGDITGGVLPCFMGRSRPQHE